MYLLINDKEVNIDMGITVLELLKELNKKPEFLAVAVNKKFVPKLKYPEYILCEGDRVEIVTPHPGG